jgi:hypothetical protein
LRYIIGFVSSSISISLGTIPNDTFTVTIKEYESRKPARRCPGLTPEWVIDAVDDGLEMSLGSLLFQSGLHFARKLNPTVMTGSATNRQKAMALAWALFSMVSPYIKDDQLWVKNVDDLDVKRLCSEVLGVGAALQTLVQCQVVDGRTFEKLGGRFDFQAKSPVDRTDVYIEAKGTMNGASLDKHRASFSGKLSAPGVLTASNPRGYSRAVGVIFSIWTDDCTERGADVELLDPEHPAEDAFEEMVREVIAFYATVLDEVVGKANGASQLLAASKSRNLFVKDGEAPIDINVSGRFPIDFHSSTLRLRTGKTSRTFMGTFWEPRAAGLEATDPLKHREYPFQYVGIDRDVLISIQERDFEFLLSMRKGKERMVELRSEAANGVLYLDRYGVLRAWLDKIPEVIDLKVTGEI